MWERRSFERELDELGVREFEQSFNPEPVGFVLHTNYGQLRAVVEAGGKRWQPIPIMATRHRDQTHGFTVDGEVTRQILRFRILPLPFEAGSADLEKTIRNVLAFAKQLQEGCAKAREQKIVIRNNAGAVVRGRPRPFEIRNLTDGPVARLPFSNAVKLDPKDGDAFGPDCSVWAQPVATITVPLKGVGKLIDLIEASEKLSLQAPAGKGWGLPLSGKRARRGRRSDAIYYARDEVRNARKKLLARKLVLSDRKTKVDAATFSEDLSGFLMLIASYLWSNKMKDAGDYEMLPESYLPIAVHAPFSEIFRSLKPAEQAIFRELFAVGDARLRLFEMAQSEASRADGARKLLPPGPKGLIHTQQQTMFGAPPTWDDLVDHTIDSRHRNWGDRPLVAISYTHERYKFSKTQPWVALALERIPTVDATHWGTMMRTVAQLRKNVHTDLRDI
jgi:hypothetical protein